MLVSGMEHLARRLQISALLEMLCRYLYRSLILDSQTSCLSEEPLYKHQKDRLILSDFGYFSIERLHRGDTEMSPALIFKHIQDS